MKSEYYTQELEETQKTFSESVEDLFLTHFNNFIKKYGGWKKYPRKIKKRLKKGTLWELRHRTELFKKGDFHVLTR